MSKNNLSSNNEPLVKLSPKRKRTRASARLQQVHEEKGQVDNTPSGGQPDLSEPLGHEAPTSTAYIGLHAKLMFYAKKSSCQNVAVQKFHRKNVTLCKSIVVQQCCRKKLSS